MKNRHISKITLVVCLTLLPLLGQGQTTSAKSDKNQKLVPKSIKYPHLYFGFYGEYGMLELSPEKTDFTYTTDPTYGGGAYLELKVMKWLGVEVAGTYKKLQGTSKYNGNIDYSLNGLVDSDGDAYNSVVYATAVKEQWSTNVIELPFSLKVQLPLGNWTIYVKPGVSYNLVSGATYEQTGVYTRNGVYSAYNITLTDLPQHGFYAKRYITSNSDLAFENFINPFVGFGLIFPARSGNFYMEGKYYPGSSNLATAGNGHLFEGPDNMAPLTDAYVFESLSEESGALKLSGLSFNIGFRF